MAGISSTELKSDQPVEMRKEHDIILNCLCAVVATFSATLLRLLLAPVVGSGVPFVTYFAATLVLAWFRGFWPAALNIPLSVVACAYFVLPALDRTLRAAMIGFSVLAFMASFLIDFQRRTLERARKAEAAQARIASENAILLKSATRSEEELRLANEELRRSNRDLETFAYSASHDLREPLRNITIFSKLLEREAAAQLTGESASFLEHIKSSAQRMDKLLADLLTYSRATRIESGPPPKVNASEVLTNVVTNLRGHLDGAEAVVTADPLPVVQIHESSLALLFQNLLSNAVKYRGPDAPRVHFAAREQNGDYVFSILDNGIGIEGQYAEKIFELFTRLHAQTEYPGSGLGLAICKRLVAHYGGKIWLERSEPGHGSTFCFSLPEKRDA